MRKSVCVWLILLLVITATVTAQNPAFMEYDSVDGETATLSTTYVTKISSDFSAPQAGQYLYFGQLQSRGSSLITPYSINMRVDGVSLGNVTREPDSRVKERDNPVVIGQRMFNFTQGIHTIELQHLTSDPLFPSYAKNARQALISIDDPTNTHSITNNESPISQNVYATEAEIIFTPPVGNATEYLFIISGETASGDKFDEIHIRTLMNGVERGEIIQQQEGDNDKLTFLSHSIIELNATQQNFTLQMYSTGNTAHVHNAQITAVPLTTEWDAQYANLTEKVNITAARHVDVSIMNLTVNPSSNGEYLFLLTSFGSSTDKSDSLNLQLVVDGIEVCEIIESLRKVTDVVPMGCIYQASLNGSTQAEVLLSHYNPSLDNASIEFLQLSAFRMNSTSPCVEDWQSSTNNGSCSDNNTYQSTLTYNDANTCGTFDDLPVDNGTITYPYCNYCDPDWLEHEGGIHECQLNNTRFVEYFDNNFCYAMTNLTEDSPPIDEDSWVSCSYYHSDFNCSISDEPYIRQKMEYTCLLPTGSVFECVNTVSYGFDDILQVNPQKTERTEGGLINIKGNLESRESFTTNNGLLNAYFTDKNLVAETTFTITTTCSNGSNTIKHEKAITPKIKDLDKTPTWLLWGKNNATYIVILLLLLIVASLILGSLYYNAKGSYK